ncbi:MAG: hypothetical protein M1834_008153 [Cirrosporium novae-zelandiae]|nr:MAG: hypothetical protein M1834_008153 [Cirrosporium novae-zelandiae]
MSTFKRWMEDDDAIFGLRHSDYAVPLHTVEEYEYERRALQMVLEQPISISTFGEFFQNCVASKGALIYGDVDGGSEILKAEISESFREKPLTEPNPEIKRIKTRLDQFARRASRKGISNLMPWFLPFTVTQCKLEEVSILLRSLSHQS